MTRRSNIEQFCWEQILSANRLFRVSHLFAPPRFADQLLALHALYASLELINSEITDETVALGKMNWWQGELSHQQAGVSHHPVVSLLRDSGALEKFPEGAVMLLLGSAGARFDALAPTDEDEFLQLCKGIYHPQVMLEMAVGGNVGAMNETMLVNGGLIQLLRESGRRKENAFWWVPLSLLARFNVKRRDLECFRDSEESRVLFTHILGLGEVQDDGRLLEGPAGSAKRDGLVHLQLMIALHCRQIERLQSVRPSMYTNELARWRTGDLLSSWKLARQLNRKSASSFEITDD
jgi:hypothetical protein